jgi:hypothetical protein
LAKQSLEKLLSASPARRVTVRPERPWRRWIGVTRVSGKSETRQFVPLLALSSFFRYPKLMHVAASR